MRALLKMALYALLIYGAYHAAYVYSIYRFATYLDKCTTLESLCDLGRRKASNDEVTKATGSAYTCAMKQQSVVESWVLPIPEAFSSPPAGSMSYKDIHVDRNCTPK
jgi:hypothetical protein